MAQLISHCLCVQISHQETSQLISNESEADQAPLQHMELFLIIINGWKPSTIITRCSTIDASAILYPTEYELPGF